MSLERVFLMAAACTCMSGCHLFSKLNPDCHSPQVYQRALSEAPLKVPVGMTQPNTQGALVIPAIGVAPPPPGPKDACLDIPPRYQPAPTNKAAAG